MLSNYFVLGLVLTWSEAHVVILDELNPGFRSKLCNGLDFQNFVDRQQFCYVEAASEILVEAVNSLEDSSKIMCDSLRAKVK